MTVMVAFDGSGLSVAALRRGVNIGDAFDSHVVVVSVVPEDPLYAADQGWVDDAATYDPEGRAESFALQVDAIAPDAEFVLVPLGDDVVPRDVANELRSTAYDIDADMLVLGSEDAGRVVAPVSSVGDTVVSSTRYDVHIVRDIGD
jgi:nucleotide-binding universal stress UspA family protein